MCGPRFPPAKASQRGDLQYRTTEGALRDGKWKLHWKVLLPPQVELFDLDADPSEKTDVSKQNPEKVAELQQKVIALARQMAPPLFYAAALRSTLSAPLATPRRPLRDGPGTRLMPMLLRPPRRSRVCLRSLPAR